MAGEVEKEGNPELLEWGRSSLAPGADMASLKARSCYRMVSQLGQNEARPGLRVPGRLYVMCGTRLVLSGEGGAPGLALLFMH